MAMQLRDWLKPLGPDEVFDEISSPLPVSIPCIHGRHQRRRVLRSTNLDVLNGITGATGLPYTTRLRTQANPPTQ